jgi:hypothetical protein
MVAQDCRGASFRQAALKLIGGADVSEVLTLDLPQAGTQELYAPDAHARAK